MRLSAPFRLLVSCGVIILWACASLAYARPAAKPQPAPLYQGPTATPTATSTPALTNTPAPRGGNPALTPATAAANGIPSAFVTYEFTLRNNGPGADTFTLSFPSNTTSNGSTPFEASLNIGRAVALGPDQVRTFTVVVQIPGGAPIGTISTIVLRATSGENTNNFAETTIRTTVIAPTPTVGPTVTATPTSTATGTATATRTITPTNTPGPLCRDTFEPDDSLGSAKEIRVNVPQTRAICPNGDADYAFFGGIAGKVYTIDVPTMQDGLDLTLGLYDSAGNLIAFNDDFPRNNDPTDIKPRIQSFRIPANGIYYVLIRDASGGGGVGLSYTVVVIDESYGPTPTQITQLCLDMFEPDGLPEQAKLIVIREVQRNRKLCPSGDADWVRFFMKVGSTYTMRVDSRGLVGADPVMVLTDRDGTSILEFNDDAAGTLDPRISYSPVVDGYYFVQIKNVGDVGNQFIAYDLFFEQAGVGAGATTPPGTTPPPGATPPPGTTATRAPTGTGPAGTTTATPTTTGTRTTPTGTPPTATATGTATPTGGTGGTATATPDGALAAYPPPTRTALVAGTQTAVAGAVTNTAITAATLTAVAGGGGSSQGVKGAPPFVNGPLTTFVDPALERVWARTDRPVASGRATRTWMWGPAPLIARSELYEQSTAGVRQVQYFDKARMEITDWSRDRNNPWFVTNGLLVQELIDGRLQVGDNEFRDTSPAPINIAGDADDPNGPTYASFTNLLGRTADRTGEPVSASLRRDGSVSANGGPVSVKQAQYVTETGHNIPEVFWTALHARGPIDDGSREDQLVDWVFAMGYPISEAYWTKVRVGGVERDVLVQAFQRRVLTYTPSNPEGWQVEMGNVGRHYYQWRYRVSP